MNLKNALILLAIAIGQFLAPALPSLGIGESVGERALQTGIPPELPPGIFFSIWGVIFTLYLIFAAIALLKPSYVEMHLAHPLVLAGVGNVIWMVSNQLIGNIALDLILLLPILLFSWEASHRLHRMGGFDGTGRRLLAGMLTGLLSGWAAVAVSISLPRLVRAIRDLGPTDQVWISLWIALASLAILAWLYATRASRGLWFFAALGWGVTGIVLNNWTRTDMHWLAAAAGLVGLYVIWRRLAYGARPAFQ
ncbi:hypothetical protein [Henriciella litoralis]|uniref:hypothetical protein n=1 Tax=Henriciella litoralis TaxID=568102 RepID=UPI00111C5673|nr:hypothetical protein [Henriciella litoralis]